MQNELYHHGIDGQRWGVRHGPPYPLDRADHNRVIEKSKKATEKRHLSYDKSRKYAKRMTDKDLNDTIDRLQREETYRRLVSKDKEDAKASKKAKAIKREEKKLYADKQAQQKNQNELEREKLNLEKKKASIVYKVLEKVLVNAGIVTGKKMSEYFNDKIIDEWKVKDAEEKVKKNNDKALKAQKKLMEETEKEITRKQIESYKENIDKLNGPDPILLLPSGTQTKALDKFETEILNDYAVDPDTNAIINQPKTKRKYYSS